MTTAQEIIATARANAAVLMESLEDAKFIEETAQEQQADECPSCGSEMVNPNDCPELLQALHDLKGDLADAFFKHEEQLERIGDKGINFSLFWSSDCIAEAFLQYVARSSSCQSAEELKAAASELVELNAKWIYEDH